MPSMEGKITMLRHHVATVFVAEGYRRCRHGNYRAHMCIPDVKGTAVVVMEITEPICASQTLQSSAT